MSLVSASSLAEVMTMCSYGDEAEDHWSSLLRESAAMTLPSRHCYWANQSFRVQQEFGSTKVGPPELGLLDHTYVTWLTSELPHPKFCLSEKPP